MYMKAYACIHMHMSACSNVNVTPENITRVRKIKLRSFNFARGALDFSPTSSKLFPPLMNQRGGDSNPLRQILIYVNDRLASDI